mgnify:CR=1 FL=1
MMIKERINRMKSSSEISGLQSIKSMHGSSKRSIPRVQSSAYLDLYMLMKNKDRLEKEIYILDKRKKDAQKRLDEINKDMDELSKVKTEKKEEILQESKKPLGKKWNSMPLKY